MLEEYLCLGGTEVANNQRTYGYAVSSGCPVTWFKCEPCQSIRAATNDWVFPIYRTIEVTRNLALTPQVVINPTQGPNLSARWAGGGTWANAETFGVPVGSPPPGTSITTMYRKTYTATSAGKPDDFSYATVRGQRMPVTPGEVYTFSFWLRPSWNIGTPQANRFMVNEATTPEGGAGNNVTVADQPAIIQNAWTRISATYTVPAGVTFIAPWHDLYSSEAGSAFWPVVGSTLDATGLLVEKSSGVGTFFDGDTADTTAVDTFSWAGTPNESASIWNREVIDTPGHIDAPTYESQNITDAPWYDADVEASSRFYGVYIITIENLNSSTRTATVTEGILDGGVVGLVRNSTREMRTRALLVADGDDALEYGLAWLNAALATSDCQTHGSACGAVDMQFFAYCPEAPDPNAPPDRTREADDAEIRSPRYMHNVTVISGPLVEQKIKSSNGRHVGYIVEWTMVAATPWVFSTTTEIGVNPTVPSVIQDEPFNLMPYPSAELASGTVIVQTNYVGNPSLETDAAGWNPGISVITPTPTGARSTEIAAVGVASYKVATTATNSGASGALYAWTEVPLPAAQSGQRFSVTTWAALFVVAGTAALIGTRLVLEWRDATTLLRTDTIGTGLSSGGNISVTGLTPPAGSTNVRVVVLGEVASWSVGAQINLFVDAVAVTLP